MAAPIQGDNVADTSTLTTNQDSIITNQTSIFLEVEGIDINQSGIIVNQTSITNYINSVSDNQTALITNVSKTRNVDSHLTYLFPDRTDAYTVLVAGGTNNSFGNWSVVVGSNSSTFSECTASGGLHISSFVVEEVGDLDERYMAEFAYGAGPDPSSTIVSRHRFSAAAKDWLPSPHQMRVRADHIPQNDTIWYRAMCSKGNSTVHGYFRYYYC